MTRLDQKLISQLKGDGYPGRVVSIRHLPELREEIMERKDKGLFNEDFFRERLTFFSFQAPDIMPNARSIIIVAVPSAQTPVKFKWSGKSIDLILPPTYRGFNRNIQNIDEYLSKLLAADGYGVVPARLPQKLLTVRSGLAEYGRNNITYISGLGSFFQPTIFYSDLPVEDDIWSEPRRMARCQSCKACLLKCPTGAIAEDRFLLHAERCLVFHNERAATHPFPSWIDTTVHNSFMGCMICQQYCPEDKPFLDWFEGDEEFSEEETALLLGGVARDQISKEMYQKLDRLEVLDDLDKFPRNLGVFIRSIQ